MQGAIAQLLSLTAHGNEYLAGKLEKNYYPENSTFKFCKHVIFVDLERTGEEWNEKEFAIDPTSWFELVKTMGVVQFRVRYIPTSSEQIPDRMSAGFVGGGGRWLIETVKLNNSDFWEAS